MRMYAVPSSVRQSSSKNSWGDERTRSHRQPSRRPPASKRRLFGRCRNFGPNLSFSRIPRFPYTPRLLMTAGYQALLLPETGYSVENTPCAAHTPSRLAPNVYQPMVKTRLHLYCSEPFRAASHGKGHTWPRVAYSSPHALEHNLTWASRSRCAKNDTTHSDAPVPGCCPLPESLARRPHPRPFRGGGGFRGCAPRRFRPPTACAFTIIEATNNQNRPTPWWGRRVLRSSFVIVEELLRCGDEGYDLWNRKMASMALNVKAAAYQLWYLIDTSRAVPSTKPIPRLSVSLAESTLSCPSPSIRLPPAK